jgi:hypothetical protein
MKLSLAVILMMLGCTALAAGQQPGQNSPLAAHSRFGNPSSIARIYQSYIFGVVRKATKDELVLDKTQFGNDQTFKLTKKTKFIRNDKPIKMETLRPGTMVWIDMKRDKKSGDMIASKVVTGLAPTGKP